MQSAAPRRKIERNPQFPQRRALRKEPVEADPIHRNEILAEDVVVFGKSDRLLGRHPRAFAAQVALLARSYIPVVSQIQIFEQKVTKKTKRVM